MGIGKRQLFCWGLIDVRQLLLRLCDLVRVYVDAKHIVTESPQLFHVRAQAAPYVKDARAIEIGVAPDEIKASDLPETPDVAGMPQSNRFCVSLVAHRVHLFQC